MEVYKKEMPQFYRLVAERFGTLAADRYFERFVCEAKRLNKTGEVRPAFAYLAMRRYVRGV